MIRAILNVYILILVVDVILSYLPQFKNHPAAMNIRKVADFTCKPIRKLLKQAFPQDFPFDFSPFVVILLIKIFESLW